MTAQPHRSEPKRARGQWAPDTAATRRPLQPWELPLVADLGHRLDVCPTCRRVYRTTLTVWRTGLAENQPTPTEWAALARWGQHPEPA